MSSAKARTTRTCAGIEALFASSSPGGATVPGEGGATPPGDDEAALAKLAHLQRDELARLLENELASIDDEG